eukprot:TRINITY_DN66241_c8_g1_i1.p1 TRINITY_DN66241_c8_g1~~TRINITY_DN66241_c8_g1_i1.p1  ORF type:complete len:707 (+),score=392.65 TRINITY_DN66241_c8_g1_i1:360-2480(+)
MSSSHADWEANIDPESGHTFYINSKTGESRWELPEEPVVMAPPPPPPVSGGDEGQTQYQVDSEAAWEQRMDEHSGQAYFYNRQTRVSTWTNPRPSTSAAGFHSQQNPAGHQPQAYNQASTSNYSTTMPSGPSQLQRANTSHGLQTSHANPAIGTFQPKSTINLETEKMDFASPALTEEQKRDDMITHVPAQITPDKIQDVRKAKLKQDQYSMTKWAETRYQLHKKGLFGKMSVQEMMMHSLTLIPHALNRIEDKELDADAQQMFKNITSYMLDRKSSKEPFGHVHKLCKTVLACEKSTILRDEAYCQIIKQLTNNAVPSSVRRGWQLMGICTGIFPPSKEFMPYLEVFLDISLEQWKKHAELRQRILYCQQRLESTFLNGAREHAPVESEVTAAENMGSIAVRIKLVDGTFKTMAIESQTKVDDLCGILRKKMGLPTDETFGLYELSRDVVDKRPRRWVRNLDGNDRLLDVMATWPIRLRERQEIDKKSQLHFDLMFQVNLFISDLLDNLSGSTLDMYFIQGCSDVARGIYPYDREEALDLAGLHVQGRFGKADPGYLIKKELNKFVPKNVLRELKNVDNVVAAIHRRRERYKDLSQTDAKLLYMQRIRASEHYGRTCYVCMQVVPKQEKVILGIGEPGLLVMDPVTRKIKRRIRLDDVSTYSCNDGLFSIVAGNILQQKKYSYKSTPVRAQAMMGILEVYMRKMS